MVFIEVIAIIEEIEKQDYQLKSKGKSKVSTSYRFRP
jgi:hypothetical protein